MFILDLTHSHPDCLKKVAAHSAVQSAVWCSLPFPLQILSLTHKYICLAVSPPFKQTHLHTRTGSMCLAFWARFTIRFRKLGF